MTRTVTAAGASLAAIALTFTFIGPASSTEVPEPASSTVEMPANIAMTPELASVLDDMSESEAQEFVDTRLPVHEEFEAGPQIPADDAAKRSLQLARSTSSEVGATATGCWTRKGTWTADANLGNKLWSHWNVLRWCASGTKVTSVKIQEAGGNVHGAGWVDLGEIDRGKKIVNNQAREFTQRYFRLGVGGVNLEHKKPCGRLAGLYTGGWAHSQTCSVN